VSCVGDQHVTRRGRPKTPGDVCACGLFRFCNQGWHWAPLAAFGTAKKNCLSCARRARTEAPRASVARRALPTSGAARYTFAARSGNPKLGPIPAVIASAESCPPTCGLYGAGCFAEFGVLGHHWRNAARDGMSLAGLCTRVALLEAGTLWRFGVAGDLPGQGDKLDVRALNRLSSAARNTRGFAYTHKPLRLPSERAAVRSSNADGGLVVNLSADNLEHADARAELGVGPVVVVLPSGASGDIRTPSGRRVVVCPAETRGLTCDACRLCSVADRRGIVGFRAHGQMKRTVSTIASGLSREGVRRLEVLRAEKRDLFGGA
jgi:hypothetical protein